MATKRKIHFLSAARSEFDILAPVMRVLGGDREVEATVIACAAHLSPFHGLGIDQIRADGFKVAGTVESLLASESLAGRALSFAQLVEGLTRMLAADRPDLLCVAGDREEALAAALVGNFLGVHVAHLFGGDRCIASDIDEVFRPAISKLSHFHFCATEGHRERLIRMGEAPERVWTCGATSLDSLARFSDASDAGLQQQFGLDPQQPFFLVIYHSSPTLGLEGGEREMTGLLRGALATGHPVLCSYPNFDPGNMGIRRAIDAAVRDNPGRMLAYHNLPRDTFVSLYRRASAVIGNSSSLIIEAGFLKVPGVLCGPRQDLRERGPHVLRVEPERAEVEAACLRCINDNEFRQMVKSAPSLYGDGQSAARVAALLSDVELDPAVLRKTITY